MEIPYTVEARPDTGLSNGKFGVWLFLASEVMLFAALFSSYILLRVGSTEWPHGYEELSVPMAFFNTVVLITSSVTMVMAWASLKMNDFGKFRLYLGLTILLSFVFLVVKYFEYSHHLHEGEGPWHNTYYAIYFTITGLHGLHIIGGIVVNSVLAGVRARRCGTRRRSGLPTASRSPDSTGTSSTLCGFFCFRFCICCSRPEGRHYEGVAGRR